MKKIDKEICKSACKYIGSTAALSASTYLARDACKGFKDSDSNSGRVVSLMQLAIASAGAAFSVTGIFNSSKELVDKIYEKKGLCNPEVIAEATEAKQQSQS